MTGAEGAYLALAIFGFTLFGVVLAYVSQITSD